MVTNLAKDYLALCRSIILIERLFYLKSVVSLNDNLAQSNLLNRHHHQTVLRILSEFSQHNFIELCEQYYFNSETRIDLIGTLIKKIDEQLREMDQAYTSLLTQAHTLPKIREILTREFHCLVTQNELKNNLNFINNFGFALFLDNSQIESRNYGKICKLYDTKYASIGGLMYYGFNLKDNPIYYYQMCPITVLSQTLALQSISPLDKSQYINWWDMAAHSEIQTLPKDTKNYNSILKLTLEVLELHEQGHNLQVNGDLTLFNTLQELGITKEDLYQTDFVTPHDLQSWARIKAGRGTAQDVCFIFGDLLANMAALMSGIDDQALTIMRTFNWGIISPPAQGKRPRGKASFLRYSYDRNYSNFINQLSLIFDSVKNNPQHTMNLMQNMDMESWEILKDYH